MNQQRSRRFRASKEGVELTDEKNRMREEIIQRGWKFFLPFDHAAQEVHRDCRVDDQSVHGL